MPTYLNLTLSLISQYDAMSLPEFHPPTSDANDPFSSHPALISESQPIVSVYIPTYPCSTFWLSYTISPPHPTKILYYFKLFINGTHVVSWGCGEKNNYTGKTMFGLFREPLGGLERRMLSFASEDTGRRMSSEMMEVRVYRSKGRRRMEPVVEQFKTGVDGVSKAHQLDGAGISLINAGYLHHRRHPKRYYQYALIDALDSPYATFRYYYRTWEELERLGVTNPSPSASPVISPVPSTSVDASDPIRHSQVLSDDLSSISFLSLTPSPATPHKEDHNKTPFNSPENEPSTPSHKPVAVNRIKDEAATNQFTTPNDSPLRIPPSFAFPPPVTPIPRTLSPTKLSPIKVSSSSSQHRRPLTPVLSLGRLRDANAATSHLTLPTFSFSSNETTSPSPRCRTDSTRLRQSLDSASTSPIVIQHLPRIDSLLSSGARSIRPQLSLDDSGTTTPPRSRTSVDTLRLSASATRRTEFGGLVAHLMGQSPSPKRPRRYLFSTAAMAAGNEVTASAIATTGSGNENGNDNAAVVRSLRHRQEDVSGRDSTSNRKHGNSNNVGEEKEAESEAINAAREALEGKGSAKARRKAHLGFLMGRTERRREGGKGTGKVTAGTGMGGMDGGSANENAKEGESERGRGKERNTDKERESESERKSESVSVGMRAHIRALAHGVPIQGGRGEGRRVDARAEAEDGAGGRGDGFEDEEGDGGLGEGIGLGIAL